jgi:UDP-glucose 4-epimerase
MNKCILVTGGLGYIGRHTVVKLIEEGYKIVVADRGNIDISDIIEKIVGINKFTVENIDLSIFENVDKMFNRYKNFDYIIHFAALKSVEESLMNSLEYYNNNLMSLINVLMCMEKKGMTNLIFSSSASVYGQNSENPMFEHFKTDAITPYGQSKIMCEQILMDLPSYWNICILRYFNPVGYHKSGMLDEKIEGKPSGLFPYIIKVLKGDLPVLKIFGKDWHTKDGTCERDFIHINDLVEAHVKCLDSKPGKNIYNVGTGIPCTVLELVQQLEKTTGRQIPYEFVKRREGDICSVYADVSKIYKELGWVAKFTINDV